MSVRIVKPGTFKWPWDTPVGLLVITGASGGGGGGGGAFCMEGLPLYTAGGGAGGTGGDATTYGSGARLTPPPEVTGVMAAGGEGS